MGCFNYLTCPRLLKHDKAADMSAITIILGIRDIRERKRLKGKEHVLDHITPLEGELAGERRQMAAYFKEVGL